MKRQPDSGATLVEVLIASMVLGLAGVAIVGSLFVSRTTSDRIAAKSTALRDLATLSQQVAMLPFAPCSSTPQASPYQTPAPPTGTALTNIAITVKVGNALGTMEGCTGSTNSQTAPMQLVTVSATFSGQTLSKSVMKVRP